MFSAPKLNQSLSTSGPSASVQPMAPKIAAISSMVRAIGWIRPVSRGRGGRVGSIVSRARRSSSAAASSSALRASRSPPVSASFNWFSAAPRSRRCSGGVLPRSRSRPVSEPLRPSTAMRTASQARKSVAAASAASVSFLRASRSSVIDGLTIMISGAINANGHPETDRVAAEIRFRRQPRQASAAWTLSRMALKVAGSS